MRSPTRKIIGRRRRRWPDSDSRLFTPTGESPAKVSSGHTAEPNRGTSRRLPCHAITGILAGMGALLLRLSTLAAKMTLSVRWITWEKVSSKAEYCVSRSLRLISKTTLPGL